MKKIDSNMLKFNKISTKNANQKSQIKETPPLSSSDMEFVSRKILFPPNIAFDSILGLFGSDNISLGTAIDYFEKNLIKSFDYTDIKEAFKFGEEDEYVKVILDNDNEYIFSTDTKNMIAIKNGDEYVSLGEDGLEGLTSVIALSELDSLADVTIDDGRIAVSTEIGEVFYYNKDTYELEGVKTSDYQFYEGGYFEGSGKYVSFEKVNDLYEESYTNELTKVYVLGDHIFVQGNDYHFYRRVDIETGDVSDSQYQSSTSDWTNDKQRLYYLKSINKYGKGEWKKPDCYFGV